MANKPVAKKAGPIELPELKRGMFRAYVIGEAPLIVHSWSQKALVEMLAKQMGQKLPKYPKSPVQDFLGSIYRLQDGGYGFPGTGLKNSMVTACTSMNKEIFKTTARQAFYIIAEQGSKASAFAGLRTPEQLVRLYSPEPPQIREDAVKLNGLTADIRYRAEFSPWAMIVDIRFNRMVVTESTIAALIDTAGFAVGLGEWRNEKSGVYGSFRLADKTEQVMIHKWAKAKQKEPALPDEAQFLTDLAEAVRIYGEADSDPAEASQAATLAAVLRSKNGGANQGVKQ